MGSFRNLLVWKKSFAMCIAIYDATELFPTHERYGLTNELRKTARSVVCNVAEGHRRTSRKEFLRFLDIAQGSVAELETQLLIAEARNYFTAEVSKKLLSAHDEVGRMLSGLGATIRRQVGALSR